MRTAAAGLDLLPRLPLNPVVTALLPVPALATALGGPALWMKRDDLIPFAFGGNKVRGLELIVADAVRTGADTLVTGAGPLSNHVRATAAAAAFAGLRLVAVYWGDAPRDLQANHRLTSLLGAEIHFTGETDRGSVDPALLRHADRVRAAGGRPYIIPRGGACPLGVIAHLLAVREALAQCAGLRIAPERVVMAVGSGGTLAGWLLGSKLLGAPWRLEGFAVSRPAHETLQRVLALAGAAAGQLDLPVRVDPGDVAIHDGFIGDGYGVPSPEGKAVLSLAARRAGIFLDPTYTAKALAGYRALAASGHYRGVDSVLFLHTGGAPALFVGDGAGA